MRIEVRVDSLSSSPHPYFVTFGWTTVAVSLGSSKGLNQTKLVQPTRSSPTLPSWGQKVLSLGILMVWGWLSAQSLSLDGEEIRMLQAQGRALSFRKYSWKEG